MKEFLRRESSSMVEAVLISRTHELFFFADISFSISQGRFDFVIGNAARHEMEIVC